MKLISWGCRGSYRFMQVIELNMQILCKYAKINQKIKTQALFVYRADKYLILLQMSSLLLLLLFDIKSLRFGAQTAEIRSKETDINILFPSFPRVPLPLRVNA